MNEAIHRASPVYSQMGYIGTGLALCIAGEHMWRQLLNGLVYILALCQLYRI